MDCCDRERKGSSLTTVTFFSPLSVQQQAETPLFVFSPSVFLLLLLLLLDDYFLVMLMYDLELDCDVKCMITSKQSNDKARGILLLWYCTSSRLTLTVKDQDE